MVRTISGRVVKAGDLADGYRRLDQVLHVVPADQPGAVGHAVEVARWRDDDDNRELEIEVIRWEAVESIVWRDPKRKR
jgi:hypothetical protein